MKVSVICCLMDDPFTFLWGNSSFFRLAGYAMEEFLSLFPSLQEYYIQFPEDFTAIRREAEQAVKAGRSDIDMTIRLPRQTDGFSWVRLLGTVTADPAVMRPVIQLELADISALVSEKEEQAWLCEQKQHCFRSVLDTYEGNAYVSDIDTYELLYLNQTSCEVLGRPPNWWAGNVMRSSRGGPPPAPSVPTTNCAGKNSINGNFIIPLWAGHL